MVRIDLNEDFKKCRTREIGCGIFFLLFGNSKYTIADYCILW